ncbi:DUF559 domain-containing protein [Microbacterium pumilum]|uniref:DUF559 domain-containing protein n=1 Tax=Microbacterium pumilum TaxID=344165 RepID=A0ABN2RTB2_9MICO
MSGPTPLPEQLEGRAFSLREADELGVPRGRLRRGDLETPLRGVRVRRQKRAKRTPKKPWKRLRKANLARARIEAARLPADAAFSHITAGVALGFPLEMGRLRHPTTHVTSTSDDARRRRPEVKVHPLPKDQRHVVAKGLRVTHPVDTWCALSAMLSIDELVAIGDHLVRRQSPDATIEELRLAVERYAGRWGAKRLREAMALVRPRTDSPKETEVRLLLVRAGLPEPTINVPVRDRNGHHIKLGDMVYEEYRVLVEYDGEQHRTDSAQYDKDAADLERASASGWLVIRVRKGQLRSPYSIVARVRRALHSRGHFPSSPVTDATRR